MAHAFSLDQGHHTVLISSFLFSHPDVGSCLSFFLVSADYKSQPFVFSSRSLFIFRFPISAVHDNSRLRHAESRSVSSFTQDPCSALFTLQILRLQVIVRFEMSSD